MPATSLMISLATLVFWDRYCAREVTEPPREENVIARQHKCACVKARAAFLRLLTPFRCEGLALSSFFVVLWPLSRPTAIPPAMVPRVSLLILYTSPHALPR